MTGTSSSGGALDAEAALDMIDFVMATVAGTPATITPHIAGLTAGKLYEFYVLARLIEDLAWRGWTSRFVGTSLVLKASPGAIQPGDAHFEIRHPHVEGAAEIHTDIQVTTLGAPLAATADLSFYHEIDIVVVLEGATGMPGPHTILLGIECKAFANFRKSIVREVLGRRRELSFFRPTSQPCCLDGSEPVNADPPTEYWLAYTDPAGDNYRESPKVFGIEFKHWQP